MVSRRRFLQGCALAGAATFSGLLPGCLSDPSPPAPRRVDYVGAAVLSGPVPRALPLLPLRVLEGGEVAGDPRPAGVPGGVLDWYKYCGKERAPGLQDDYRGDERLRYWSVKEVADGHPEPWFEGREGQVLRVDDIPPGQGAKVAWRSEGQTGKEVLLFLVLNFAATDVAFGGASEATARAFMVPAREGRRLVGFSAACNHFCCVTDWHESPLARAQGLWDTLFCACHLGVHDAKRVVPDFFTLGEGSAA